jgi:hypothetical protein
LVTVDEHDHEHEHDHDHPETERYHQSTRGRASRDSGQGRLLENRIIPPSRA